MGGGEDKCKCIPKRTRRGRFRCIKPTCANHSTKKVNGKNIQVCPKGCCDKRKCRKAKKGGRRRPNRNRNRNRNSGSNRGRRSFFLDITRFLSTMNKIWHKIIGTTFF